MEHHGIAIMNRFFQIVEMAIALAHQALTAQQINSLQVKAFPSLGSLSSLCSLHLFLP